MSRHSVTAEDLDASGRERDGATTCGTTRRSEKHGIEKPRTYASTGNQKMGTDIQEDNHEGCHTLRVAWRTHAGHMATSKHSSGREPSDTALSH
jgi:hypothetical protein